MSDAVLLEILAAPAPATIQDAGRTGFMAEGVPVGGALCPERLALANRRVGNPPGSAAIESFGSLVVAARGGPALLSVDGVVTELLRDEELRIVKAATSRLVYVAAAGGFELPVVLGGQGTLLTASFGGVDGRPLRRGDRLGLGAARTLLAPALGAPPELPAPDLHAPIRVIPGPDLERFAADALGVLCGEAWSITPASNRVGMRLGGPPLQRLGDDAGRSLPMARGAIQVASGGVPIVFGPDHPTTGGYPVIATVIRADWGRLEERPIGSEVRFQSISVERARSL